MIMGMITLTLTPMAMTCISAMAPPGSRCRG